MMRLNLSFRQILKTCLIFIFFNGYLAAGVKLWIEVEDFEALSKFPFYQEGRNGWYALESSCRSYGADGKATQAIIHQNAPNKKITTKLNKPLPKGTYHAFLRVHYHYKYTKDSIVRLHTDHGHIDFNWKGRGRWKWLGPIKIDLDSPSHSLSLEAIQFGGYGYRQLYEPETLVLSLDSLYITDDLKEKKPPKLIPTSNMSFDRDIYVNIDDRQLTQGKTHAIKMNTPLPSSPAIHEPIKLDNLPGRKNKWPNSSFELMGLSAWACLNNLKLAHIFSDADRVKSDAFHASHSLKLPKNLHSVSPIYVLDRSGEHTFSLYIRAEKETPFLIELISMKKSRKGPGTWHNRDKKLISLKGTANKSWTRHALSAKLNPGPISIMIHAQKEHLFIDAIQLEEGKSPSDYAPRAEVEASMTTLHPGHILHENDPQVIKASFYNDSKQKSKADLHYTIKNFREELIQRDRLNVQVDPGSHLSVDVSLKNNLKGIFSVIYGDGKSPRGELVYSVLTPAPSHDKVRHRAASNMDPVENVLKLMKRMGEGWQLYCKLRNTFPANVNPKPGEYKFTPLLEGISKHKKIGYDILGCLWPSRPPKHMKDEVLSGPNAFANGRGVVRSPKSIPKMDVWSEYCKELADKVGAKLPNWCIDDETEMYFSAKDFAKIADATISGFNKSKNAMKIAFSCIPDYTEDVMYHMKEDVKNIAAFGASSYNFEYWDSRKVARLQNRYQIPWYCIGVGSNRQPQMYHSIPGYREVYSMATKTAREIIYLCLVQDAKIIGHYTGRMMMRKGHYNTDYPLMEYDGTPLPHGYTYHQLIHFLADAKPLRDIYIQEMGTMIFVYETPSGLGAVTWANNSPDFDIHYKTEPRAWNAFSLKASSSDIEILDMFGNPRSDVKTSNSSLSFDLNEEPCFIINKKLSRDAFIRTLSNAGARPEELQTRLSFITNSDGGIDLAVTLKNNTDKSMKNLEISAEFPDNRMVTKTAWLMKSKKASLKELPASSTRKVYLSLNANGHEPVENSTLTVWVKADGRDEKTWYETCWLSNARPGSIEVDGDTKDWKEHRPSWLWHTHSWARFGRHSVQLYKGGEHFLYAKLLDGRANFMSRYDKTHLYLGIQIEDEQFLLKGPKDQRDHLTLYLDDISSDIFQQGPEKAKFRISLLPEKDNIRIETAGLDAAAVKAAHQMKGKSMHIEVAISLKALSIDPDKARTMSLDLLLADADKDGQNITQGIMRWAGRSRSLGQLTFNKHQ